MITSVLMRSPHLGDARLGNAFAYRNGWQIARLFVVAGLNMPKHMPKYMPEHIPSKHPIQKHMRTSRFKLNQQFRVNRDMQLFSENKSSVLCCVIHSEFHWGKRLRKNQRLSVLLPDRLFGYSLKFDDEVLGKAWVRFGRSMPADWEVRHTTFLVGRARRV